MTLNLRIRRLTRLTGRGNCDDDRASWRLLPRNGEPLLRGFLDMNSVPPRMQQWDESPSAAPSCFGDNPSMFQLLFERSADAIFQFDPKEGVFVDCNVAAVDLMRAGTKEQLLRTRPEDLSPPFQPDGKPTPEKSAEIVALVEKHGSHRFEWVGRRFDGQEVPLEVLVTQICADGRKLNVSVCRDITERKRTEAALRESEQKFRGLFEASSDGILILDAVSRRIVDCNAAALRMKGGGNREWLLAQSIESLSAERQPDGRSCSQAAQAWIERALADGPQRFEWMATRYGGESFLVEVLLTPLHAGDRLWLVASSRDISERKKAERELRELNQSLERRVAERTAALATTEAQFRALVEHAPEAIVVFDGDTERILFGNEHACALYGVPMEKLPELTPETVSAERQAGGRSVRELAREKMDEALAGGMPVFEWIHRRADGTLIPTEVRLLRLPAEGRNLIRASIIDNTERKRAERALRESEQKFRALFEDSSQGVVLHDEHQILEANPAALRILGLQNPQALLGKHPSETSPPFQPSGESSVELARKYIHRCLANGSARFEWTSCTAQGKAIPLEVSLTRIQWSGRQVIQALIHDISERKKTEAELRASEARLRESEARFSVAFQASPVIIGILRVCDGKFVLANDALVNWLGCSRDETLGQSCAALGMWENLADRASVWEEVGRVGRIRQRECRWRNRRGERFTILLSAETITLDNAPHVLLLALDISQRKQAEVELRASEARLRESEARFSAAFQASPIITGISTSDGRFVLANDAFLNWVDYSRDEVLGRTAIDLGIWENPEERQRFWKDVRSAGLNRARECRLRNRHGKVSTMLMSGVSIEFDGVEHLMGMMVDISQRKLAETELHRTVAREKELSQLKSNFVSMVSHEYRTPLGIIQTSAELLRDFYQKMPPAEREEQLSSIARNTQRMAGMMEEVLVLSRLDAGKLHFQPAALDFGAFCRCVVDEVLSATNRRCPIELSLGQVPVLAQADEQLLGHIFTNLLSNAVKYSEPGTTVRFAVERDGPDAVCTVRDQGIGISEEDQQHLFKAFHRGGNVGTRPGTGLGLLLVKRCADLHGGKVELHSKVGEGATVTVRLPVFLKTP
jgi:PAS domain S-box-containing protein